MAARTGEPRLPGCEPRWPERLPRLRPASRAGSGEGRDFGEARVMRFTPAGGCSPLSAAEDEAARETEVLEEGVGRHGPLGPASMAQKRSAIRVAAMVNRGSTAPQGGADAADNHQRGREFEHDHVSCDESGRAQPETLHPAGPVGELRQWPLDVGRAWSGRPAPLDQGLRKGLEEGSAAGSACRSPQACGYAKELKRQLGNGAPGRDRTSILAELDFESSASTSSATGACP